jgi:hypothetical protein
MFELMAGEVRPTLSENVEGRRAFSVGFSAIVEVLYVSKQTHKRRSKEREEGHNRRKHNVLKSQEWPHIPANKIRS